MTTGTSTLRRGGAALAFAAVVLTSCSSPPAAELDPAAAATTLARNLDLTDDQAGCMRNRFEAEPSAAAVLNTSDTAADDDRDRYLVAIRACLPPDDLGSSLSATVRDQLPDADAAQATCVHDNVVALPEAEQDRLYLYFSNPAALDVADVGPAGADLLRSCDLLGATPDTSPPTTAESTGPAEGSG